MFVLFCHLFILEKMIQMWFFSGLQVEQSNAFKSVKQQLIDWTLFIEELDLEHHLTEQTE